MRTCTTPWSGGDLAWGEVWNKRKNGKLYPQQLMISAVREGGKISQYIAIFSDLSQTKLAEQKIAAQANYDNLTGLPNRWLFGRCLARFCESGERFALMVLDLNNFRAVNNSMDHHVGDALLREMDRLVSRVRTEDLVAPHRRRRVCLPGARHRQPPSGRGVAKRVIGGFACPFMLANQHLYVTATLGSPSVPMTTAATATSSCAMPSRPRSSPSARDAPRHLQRLHAGRGEPAPPDAARSGGGHPSWAS